MLEHPNAAIIRNFYGTSGGPDAVAHLLDEGVVWHLPGGNPMSGDHVGRNAVLAAMRYFEGVQLEVHDVVANDDHAVALLRARGTRKGRQYDALEIDAFHIKDGKITEFWSFSEDQRLTDEYWS